MKIETKKPLYGNWVSSKLIGKCMALALLFGALEAMLLAFVPGWLSLKILVALPAVLFIVSVPYFLRARWLFAGEGGNIQNKVLDLIVSHIDWNEEGRALDIGCGSGAGNQACKEIQQSGNNRYRFLGQWVGLLSKAVQGKRKP